MSRVSLGLTRPCIDGLRIIAGGLSAAALLAAADAGAAQWWVDQAAESGGDGSETQPFQTINDVKAVLQTGDYDLAYDCLSELGFPQRSRAALLVARCDGSHRFLETVARNAGYNWKLFTDECAALKWLGQ